MRFTTIIVTYFVIGAVMWGGGAIAWDDSGLGQYLIEDPLRGEGNENVQSNVEQAGGPIQEAAGSIGGGGLLAIWNIVVQFIAYLFWPLSVLVSVNAPPRAVTLIGGTLVMAFLATMVRIFRGPA